MSFETSFCLYPMDDTITKEVLLSLQDGDHKAFEMVFVAYFDKVKYFVERIIRSEDEAEELAQDIFVKLWVNRKAIDIQKSFSGFLFTMAHNASFNYLKHKDVQNNYLSTNDLSEEVDSTEEMMYAKEIALLIEMTVNRMPAQRKNIFQLSRNEGLSNDEIASRLHISKKTVENQLSLALKELRKVITLFIVFIS